MSKIRLYGDTSGYVELAAPDVSDDATLTLPTGAAGFLPGNAGIGSNVVLSTRTTDFSTTSTSPQSVLTASITLSSASNRVLVMASARGFYNNSINDFVVARISRGGTLISEQAAQMAVADRQLPYNDVVLDTPGSVGPHTYELAVYQASGGTAEMQGSVSGSPIQLIVVEVAA